MQGRAHPIFNFTDGRCEVMLTLDLREGTLRFTHGGASIGTIAAIKGINHQHLCCFNVVVYVTADVVVHVTADVSN